MKYEDIDLSKEDRYESLTNDERKVKMEFGQIDRNEIVQQSLSKFAELGITTVTDMDSYECRIDTDKDGMFYVSLWTTDMGRNGHEFDIIASNEIILNYAIPKFIGAIKEATFFDAD